MLINRNIVALFALPFMASATASELSIGAGAAYNESPYRGYNENTKAIPLISYEGDSFYVRQTTLGFILSQSEKNELSLDRILDAAGILTLPIMTIMPCNSLISVIVRLWRGLPGITTSVGEP